MTEGLSGVLDAAIAGPGVVRVDEGGRTAEVEVVEADKLAVRVLRVRVEREAGSATGVREEAERLTEALRGLPERVVPVEVSPALGGAVLRSAPEDVQNRQFFEARTDGRVTELERVHAPVGGERRSVPFTITRDALSRIVGRVASG